MSFLLNPFGVCDGNIDLIFQKIKDRNPIFTGGFHAGIPTIIFERLLLEVKDKIVEGREALFLIRRLNTAELWQREKIYEHRHYNGFDE